MSAPIDARENDSSIQSSFQQTLEDEADEWLFSSINDYKDLYMYEFQYPTRSMCWVSDERVCVACLLPENRSEILEMILPARLLAEKEDKALTRGRDFKVFSGGFHSRHVHDVQYVGNSRKILTTEKGENLIRVWRLGDEENDVIQTESEVHSSVRDRGPALMTVNEDGSSVLFGTTLKNVQEVDISTLQQRHSHAGASADVLSGIEYLDGNTFATCGRMSGHVHMFDKRRHGSKHTMELASSGDVQAPCVFAVSGNNEVIAVLDSGGCVRLWDTKAPKEPVSSVNTGLQNTRGDTIQIQVAHFSSSTVSVSGFDGLVYLYETKQWPTTQSTSSVVKPDFVHRGHEVCREDEFQGQLTVLHHSWHSSQPRLVLSSASDGSLHAWNYDFERSNNKEEKTMPSIDKSDEVPSDL